MTNPDSASVHFWRKTSRDAFCCPLSPSTTSFSLCLRKEKKSKWWRKSNDSGSSEMKLQEGNFSSFHRNFFFFFVSMKIEKKMNWSWFGIVKTGRGSMQRVEIEGGLKNVFPDSSVHHSENLSEKIRNRNFFFWQWRCSLNSQSCMRTKRMERCQGDEKCGAIFATTLRVKI